MPSPARDPDGLDGSDDAEELSALVSELESTLTELRSELAARQRDERDHERGGGRARERGRGDHRDHRDRRDRRTRRDRGLRRPPGPGELLRFTTDHTIPTVVAVLEATIEALELLQGLLDLAAPGGSPDRERRARRGGRGRRGRRGVGRSVLSEALSEGVTSATDRAAGDAADALVRLREALAEADLPEDGEGRDLVADARDLSADLERRVRESRGAVDRERERERREGRAARDRGGPVTIEVGDPDEAGPGDTADADEEADSPEVDASEADAPEVDVDAELESIKRQMRRDGDDGEEGDGAEDDDPGDADAGSADGS